VFFVGNFTNGGAALDVDLANLTRAHTHLGVSTFTSQQRRGCTGGACDLRALANLHLDAMNRRAHRNIADRKGVTDADWRFRAADDGGTNFKATRGNDVSTLAIGVADQRNVRRAVGVVLNALNLRWNRVLVALEVHNTVMVLVAATFMTNRDVTVVVAARLLELRLQQRCVRLTLEQVSARDLHHAAHTRRGGFHFNDGHYADSPPRFSSCPAFSVT